MLIKANNEPPKVWHVGGSDVDARIPLLQSLHAVGFAVGAVGCRDAAPFDAVGMEYYRYPLARSINPASDLRSFIALSRRIRAGRPDIVHGFDTKPCILVPPAGRLAGAPVRLRTITGLGYVFSDDGGNRALRSLYGLLHRLARPFADWTVFQNEDDLRLFSALHLVPPERASIIRGSGIDPQSIAHATGSPDELAALRQDLGLGGRKIILMASRVVAHKGVRELLAAAQRLRHERDDLIFLLAGRREEDGADVIDARTLAEAAPYVRTLGHRTDLVRLLQIADLFVLPSYYREGVPRVLLEAALVGCPIVTCDMPGCRDVARDGVSGWLVAPRDADALARTINAALAAPADKRNDMLSAARTLVERNFSLEIVTQLYARLYARLLREKQAGLVIRRSA